MLSVLVSKQTDSQNSVPGSGKSPSTRQKNRNLSQTESDVVSINGSVDLFTDSIKDDVISETSSDVSGPSVKKTHQKLFSIFDGTPTSSPAHKGNKSTDPLIDTTSLSVWDRFLFFCLVDGDFPEPGTEFWLSVCFDTNFVGVCLLNFSIFCLFEGDLTELGSVI
jgi:hypothetical protein